MNMVYYSTSNDLLEAFKKFLERKEKEKPLNTTVTNKEIFSKR